MHDLLTSKVQVSFHKQLFTLLINVSIIIIFDCGCALISPFLSY